MDLLEAKNRIAEALVESIFRRARYEIDPFRSELMPLRFGREDFSPDFVATHKAEDGTTRRFLVEVKYRPSIAQFVSVENQRGDRSVFAFARRHWGALYFVLATDRPEAGRSCFQAISLATHRAGERFSTVDLADLDELGIFRRNIEDHEELGRRIFSLLTGA